MTRIQAMSAAQAKADLRAHMRAVRSYEAAQNPKADEALMARTPYELLASAPRWVAGYYPIHDEIQPGGVMQRFLQVGAGLCLPVVVADDEPLIFRAFSFGDALTPGRFGVLEPDPSAAVVTPDVVLTPLLAFDQEGRRLGYGGGFYDRTFAALRAAGAVVAVGLAYEVQRAWDLADGRHDERLDWIVTEAAAYKAVKRQGATA